jgi:hypothetical protein
VLWVGGVLVQPLWSGIVAMALILGALEAQRAA